MSNTALVTGASGGIGAEFARYHAQQGGDLVLVARSEDALLALKAELETAYSINAMVLVEDLSDPASSERIFQATEAAGVVVEVLINNAGFGGHGKFHERELKQDVAMMQVNMNALVNLTHLYMHGMVERNSGRMLHVASTAAFMPGPLQAVYYATKSFVVSFSQAISQELSGTKVTSTVLCPGPVNTGFVQAADLEGLPIFERAVSAESVAQFGYDAMMKGKLLVINERIMGFMLNWLVPLMPRKLILNMSEKFMKKAHEC